MRWTSIAIGVATMALAAPAVGIAHAEPNPPPPPPAPKTTIDSDGTYAVGTDIVPGTYSSAGPTNDGACYWKRVNGGDIIDNALSKKPQVVAIQPTDTAFTTNDCQQWQLTDAPPPAQPAPQNILGQLGQLFLRPPPAPPANP